MFGNTFRLSLARSASSTHICCSECVDVAVVLASDQIKQILVIEMFACVSDGAYNLVIGKIDLYWLSVAVVESVQVFCSHVICVV